MLVYIRLGVYYQVTDTHTRLATYEDPGTSQSPSQYRACPPHASSNTLCSAAGP